jgi:hypothetical protein
MKKYDDVDELVEDVKLEEKKELNAEDENQLEIEKIIEKKESTVCAVCLKEHRFCTCVGAEKKHAIHANHVQGSTRIIPNEEIKSGAFHVELLPGVPEDKALSPGDVEFFDAPKEEESVEVVDDEPKKFFGKKPNKR